MSCPQIIAQIPPPPINVPIPIRKALSTKGENKTVHYLLCGEYELTNCYVRQCSLVLKIVLYFFKMSRVLYALYFFIWCTELTQLLVFRFTSLCSLRQNKLRSHIK